MLAKWTLRASWKRYFWIKLVTFFGKNGTFATHDVNCAISRLWMVLLQPTMWIARFQGFGWDQKQAFYAVLCVIAENHIYQARKRNPNLNFFGGVGVFHMKGWGGQKVRYVPRNQGKQAFWRDISGFCWDIPAVPERFEKKRSLFGDWYDWTTGVPDNGNDWRKFRVVPHSHPLRPPIFYFV